MKKPPVKIHRNLLRPEKKICARLYGVGIPAALNMALPSLLISALNAILASISETGVTILGIYYKLQTFLYLSVNGMIQGMRPIIGYNYGAKEIKRVKKAEKYIIFKVENMRAECTREDMYEYKRSKTDGSGII